MRKSIKVTLRYICTYVPSQEAMGVSDVGYERLHLIGEPLADRIRRSGSA